VKKLDEILGQMTASERESSAASTSSPAIARTLAFPRRPASPGAAAAEPPEPACPRCGGAGFLRRELPLDHPEFGKTVPCDCVLQESADMRLERLQRYSSLGALSRLSFDNLNPRGRSHNPKDQQQFTALVHDAIAFSEAPEGWILIHGPSGAGKTHVAAAIANACIARGTPALFVVVPDLLDHLRAAYSPTSEVGYDRLFDQVRGARVLILDDLGTQNATAWAQEKLFQVLNQRYNARLATVVTTNLPVDRLDERLRMRLTDPDLSRVYHVEASAPAVDLGGLDALDLPRIREMTFENFDTRPAHVSQEQRLSVEEAWRRSMRYAEQPEDWLVLEGAHGCGKTHLAAAIANYRLAHGERPLFLVVPDLLDYLRYAMERDSRTSFFEVFERVRSAPLLILDDLGSQSDVAWVRDRLFQLLNHRYSARLPTVITISRDSMERLEERTLARLYDPNVSAEIPIIAPAYRVDLDAPAPSASRAGRPQSTRTRGPATAPPRGETSRFRGPPARGRAGPRD
jgi:DNA replication protein DnaC